MFNLWLKPNYHVVLREDNILPPYFILKRENITIEIDVSWWINNGIGVGGIKMVHNPLDYGS